MRILFILSFALLSSCASYFLKVETPEGIIISGRAFVMNNSEDVSLSVESENYIVNFGKKGTDGSDVAEVAKEAIDTLNGPRILGF